MRLVVVRRYALRELNCSCLVDGAAISCSRRCSLLVIASQHCGLPSGPACLLHLHGKVHSHSLCTRAQSLRAPTWHSRTQVLPYKTLLQALELPDVRSLEDFIIQGCIYPGLIKCKFDQKAQCLHVQDVYSRDVRPERIAELSYSLEDMCAFRSRCAQSTV